MASFVYPTIRRDEDFVEELHGVKVADPYRWLEDPASEETKSFIEAENRITKPYVDSYPHKSELLANLKQLVDYDKYEVPSKHGESYYYYHNRTAPRPVLYKVDQLDGEPKVALDVNEISRAEGREGSVSIRITSFSESGKYMAYALSRSGSDWVEIKIKNVETMENFEETISWSKFTSLHWTHDNKGFFYIKYPEPIIVPVDSTTSLKKNDQGTETNSNTNPRIYYHLIGTPQSADTLVLSNDVNPYNGLFINVTHDGIYLVAYETTPKEHGRLIKIARIEGMLANPVSIPWISVVDDYSTKFRYLTNENTRFWFYSSHREKSPRGKIVCIDLTDLATGFVDVIPETEDVLEEMEVVHGNKLVLVYLRNVRHVIYIHELGTGERIEELDVPLGTISQLTGKKKGSEFFYKVTSFLSPGTIYRYDFAASAKPTVYREISFPKGFDHSLFTSKQVFYTSKDGTKIPMFLIHHTGLVLDSSNPTLLYGYGGFNYAIMPSFSISWLAWIRYFKNGIIAIANIRGGAEFGEEWHTAGMLDKKQNVFDDFQYAAKWLHQNNYTRPDKTAIYGWSNGGLLIGACINQAPELFGCAVASVGVKDMLRFHKFTVGSQWRREYGDPDVKEDFEYLYKYSPYHNLTPNKPYPSILVFSSDHDDRVVPLHCFKYIAQLQHTLNNTPGHMNPGLIYIDIGAGHGDKALNNEVEDAAIRLSFIALSLKCEWVA